MLKDVFTFPCPCCGKLIEVDTRSGRARAARPEEAKGGRSLDRLLDAQQRESERLGSVFDDARARQAKEADQLAEALRRAKDEAKKDKDKDQRPRNIFDLD